jgi:hypothetical protein
MSELSEAARALIRDGHTVLRPSLEDRSRVASALASRLGETALVASSGAAIGAGRWLVWQKLSGLVVGVSMAGLGATWALRGPSAEEPAPRVPSAPVVAEPRSAMVASAPAARAEPAPPPGELTAAPLPAKLAPPSDRLSEEVAILSKAASALRASKPSEALRLLGEHQRRFPSGRLVEERRAARVQALCALGNRASAQSELERLARSSPRSPHVARARAACGVTE